MICPYCKKQFTMQEAKIRSLPENRYYWGVLLKILSDYTGHTEEEMHEVCRSLFLNETITLETKEGISLKQIPRSSKELNTVEFEIYLAEIRQWASRDLGCYIPLPNEDMI
jgi:hypothetical protein